MKYTRYASPMKMFMNAKLVFNFMILYIRGGKFFQRFSSVPLNYEKYTYIRKNVLYLFMINQTTDLLK